MRVLGLVLAGAFALTAPIGVQAGSLGPNYYPMPNGWNGDWRRAPSPSPQWNGGPVSRHGGPNGPSGAGAAVWGRGCLRIGSGIPVAAPSIIPSRIGEVRLGAGVIRNRL